MEVIITEWGFQSYIDLKSMGIFTDQDYTTQLRPDAELLKTDDPFDPNHPKFSNSKFWGPATSLGKIVKYGHKMKWHNLGPGHVQLRLCVVILQKRAYICNSYVKDDKTDAREMARIKIKIQKIEDGTFVYRGML
jgi:hypothetical protein